MPPIVQPVVGL